MPCVQREPLWFIEPRTNRVELVCLACVPDSLTTTSEVDGAKAGALTTEQLKRPARASADERVSGWRGVTIHIRMGERGDGECGELLLVLTNSALSRRQQPEPTGNGISARLITDAAPSEPRD